LQEIKNKNDEESQKYRKQSENRGVVREEERVYGGNNLWKR